MYFLKFRWHCQRYGWLQCNGEEHDDNNQNREEAQNRNIQGRSWEGTNSLRSPRTCRPFLWSISETVKINCLYLIGNHSSIWILNDQYRGVEREGSQTARKGNCSKQLRDFHSRYARQVDPGRIWISDNWGGAHQHSGEMLSGNFFIIANSLFVFKRKC